MIEPTKDLEEIFLDDDYLSRITQADPSIHKELVLFLKNNQDIFSQSHEDMPEINPSAMVHKLNVSSSVPHV